MKVHSAFAYPSGKGHDPSHFESLGYSWGLYHPVFPDACWSEPGSCRYFFGMPAFNSELIMALSSCDSLRSTGGYRFRPGSSAFASSQGQAALFGSVDGRHPGRDQRDFFYCLSDAKAIQAVEPPLPIRWGIDNYLDIFIREGTWSPFSRILYGCLCFFVFAMIVSIVIFCKTEVIFNSGFGIAHERKDAAKL